MRKPEDADLPGEVWRVISGYEDYAVSNLGRVKRVKPSPGPTYVGKVLKCTKGCRGYQQAALVKDRKVRFFGVHRLVCAAFVGPCPPGKEVNHIDGNRGNPCLDNLEYVTRSENHKHAVKLGRYIGTANPAAKLSENDIPRILEALSHGDSQTAVAHCFGVHQTTISRVARGRWGVSR